MFLLGEACKVLEVSRKRTNVVSPRNHRTVLILYFVYFLYTVNGHKWVNIVFVYPAKEGVPLTRHLKHSAYCTTASPVRSQRKA